MKRSFQVIQEEELRLKAELPADRHCLQGNQDHTISHRPFSITSVLGLIWQLATGQDGYKIACDMTFSRILDHDTAEERPYKSRSNERHSASGPRLWCAEHERLCSWAELTFQR